jgi:prophage antirepressor-like protein
MSNQNLAVFTFRDNSVQVITIDAEPWFVAKDLCDVLGVKNSRDALTRLDEDEKGVASTDTLGGNQDVAIVSESGMYALVLSSRKPEAKPFRKWITSEVLPAIRKHGKYETEQPKVLLTVEKMAIASEFVKTLEKIGYELDNPRFAQGIRDLVGDAVGLGQPILPQSTEQWIGVAERAEELGCSPVLVVKHRSQLGKWVKANGLESRQEKRLCNGTQRPINLYLVTDELDDCIKEFLNAKTLAG